MQTGLPEVLTYDIIFNSSNSSLDGAISTVDLKTLIL